jgi:hypothetical protein
MRLRQVRLLPLPPFIVWVFATAKVFKNELSSSSHDQTFLPQSRMQPRRAGRYNTNLAPLCALRGIAICANLTRLWFNPDPDLKRPDSPHSGHFPE